MQSKMPSSAPKAPPAETKDLPALVSKGPADARSTRDKCSRLRSCT